MGKVSEKSSYKNKQKAERSTRFFNARQADKNFFKSKSAVNKQLLLPKETESAEEDTKS